MNLTQLSNTIVDSNNKLIDLETIYGINTPFIFDNLLLLIILQNLIEEGEWYGKTLSDISYMYILVNNIIRDNNFIFKISLLDNYYNVNTPQTSYTFDKI
jgi:hypothetical protein